jgi:predicted nucleic acid-binding protein
MTPALIIDCSMTMSWCFSDEANARSSEILDRLATEAALVPSHWSLEVINVLVMAEKRKRISHADSMQFLNLLAALDIQTDPETSIRAFDHLPPLCRAHGLSSYDAAYLELALRRNLPLASLDDDLRKAAIKLGMQVLGK